MQRKPQTIRPMTFAMRFAAIFSLCFVLYIALAMSSADTRQDQMPAWLPDWDMLVLMVSAAVAGFFAKIRNWALVLFATGIAVALHFIFTALLVFAFPPDASFSNSEILDGLLELFLLYGVTLVLLHLMSTIVTSSFRKGNYD